MRILIFGAGAVGCYVGGHLALAGHRVTLLGRARVTEPVQRSGLTIRAAGSPSSAISVADIQVTNTLPEALAGVPAFDLVIFTMKSYDTASAIQDWRRHSHANVPILCLQNGIGNEEVVAAEIGAEYVIAGVLTTAVSMDTPGVVQEEKARGIALAGDSPSHATALAALRTTQLRLRTVTTAASLKWSKLLLNIVGNATSAILDMPPDEIMRDRRLFAAEMRALREAVSIVRLQGIRIANLPGSPAAILAALARSVPPAILQPLLHTQFGSGRGAKLPSLARALRDHNPRTEVAWLNGAVALAARNTGRLAPINHTLALLVSDIASQRVPWEMYRRKPATLLAALRAAQGNPGWRYGE